MKCQINLIKPRKWLLIYLFSLITDSSFALETMGKKIIPFNPISPHAYNYPHAHSQQLSKKLGQLSLNQTHDFNLTDELKKINATLVIIDQEGEDTLSILRSPQSKGIISPPQLKVIEQKVQEAKKGSSSAQNFIGNLYVAGHLVDSDYQKAAKWFSSAALQNNSEAMLSLAKLIKEKHYIYKSEEFSNALYAALMRKANEEGGYNNLE